MMKNENNKKFIFGLFSLICVLSLYFSLKSNTINTKKVSVNEEINLGDEKDSCATKDFDKCGCDSITNTSAKEQCKRGCTYCSTCNDGSYLSEGYCYKVTASEVKDVTVSGRNYVYLAADESVTFTFVATSNSSPFTPSWSFSPVNSASGRGAGSTYYLTASGSSNGTGADCQETAYTVTATSNNASKSATVKVCKYCSKWNGPYIPSTSVYQNRQNISKEAAGCYYFVGETAVSGGWSYTGYYTRCCGSVPNTETPTPTPTSTTETTPTITITPTPTPIVKSCYGNREYLGIASSVGWQEEASTSRPYKYDGISEEDCHVINISTCNVSPLVPMAIEAETNTCEDTNEIVLQATTKCSNYDSSSEKNFYTIECSRKIVTSFDYGDDNDTNTNRFLYKGQGFKFGVKVTSIHTCTANFNKDTWVNTYNRFLEKISYISPSLVNYVKNYDKSGWTKAVNALKASKETQSEVYALWNTIENLRNIVVNGYLGFTLNDLDEEQVNITLKYNVNNKSNTKDEQLIISEKDSSSGTYTKTVSSDKYNLTSQESLKNVPKSYVISNEKNPRIIKFIPQSAYIDEYLGLDISDSEDNTIDGGNKIYIDYNVDPTEDGKPYNMIINVTGLGSNKSSVINNKCDINIGNKELLYRPIDVSNPFISAKWNIGENWLNERFSFTNTIKSDTWSLNKMYDVSLSNEDINNIKESNKSNKDKYPYLGLCDRINGAMQDNVTKKLCEMIKSTID